MSRFFVATDAREATLADLATTHRSLVLAGLRNVTWIAFGTPSDVHARLRRSWSFGRVQITTSVLSVDPGDVVVFLSAGDALQREALLVVRDELQQHTAVEMLYADSGHPTTEKVEPLSFVRRPGWSPERLRAHCYVGETLAVRGSVVHRAGGLEDLVTRHPHDRALRLSEVSTNISRLAEIVTIAKDADSRPSASLQAVVEHCARMDIDADCDFDAAVPVVNVRRRLTRQPSVAVVIPTRGTSAEVFGCERVLVVEAVRSLIEKSTYQNFHIVVVADTPTPNAVRETLRQFGDDRLQIIDYDHPFNFAEKNNLGVMSSESDLILLLNDDTEIVTADALEVMVAHFNDPSVGVVGPMLLFEDSTIQSAGHIFNPEPFDLYRARSPETAGPQNLLRVQREVSSVIAACALIRRDVFEEVGGLCMDFPANWNDIDFCLKVQLAGYRVIFTPHAHFFHFESKTRVAKLIELEVAKLGARWGSLLDDDPYFNPRLQRYINIWKTDSTSQRSLAEALG